jgi:hypothetical protein
MKKKGEEEPKKRKRKIKGKKTLEAEGGGRK